MLCQFIYTMALFIPSILPVVEQQESNTSQPPGVAFPAFPHQLAAIMPNSDSHHWRGKKTKLEKVSQH